MNKGIIITLPCSDYVTEYISQFSEDIVKEAADKRIKVRKLVGKHANRNEFEKAVKKLDYRMIIFNGHGSESFIKGHNEILVKFGLNDNLLRDRITYARSCNAGQSLGKKCMKNNKEGCFIGYELPLCFILIKIGFQPQKKI